MTENDDISHTVFVPSMKTLRIARFVNYTLIIVVLHHVLLFSLEAFSFSSFGILVLRMVSSMVFTFVLIFAIEYFRFKKKDNI